MLIAMILHIDMSFLAKRTRIHIFSRPFFLQSLLFLYCLFITVGPQHPMSNLLILLKKFQSLVVHEGRIVDFLRLVPAKFWRKQLSQAVVMTVREIGKHQQKKVNSDIIKSRIVIKSTLRMNENPSFSQAITQYISMALHIWPALQLSLAHIHEAVAPPQGSAIKPRDFTSMSSEQFVSAMTKDLHDFIMEHDIKTEHVVDFLDDILSIFNAEEQNDKTMTHMASELVLLIQEIPDGNFTRLANFRFVYNALKGKNLGHVVQEQHSESESCSEGSYEEGDEEMEQENNIQQSNQDKKMDEEAPQLTGEEKQNLEDDGWVVVKKKSKK